MVFAVINTRRLALLLGCGIFSVKEGVDFEPVPVWEEGADGKNRPIGRQAVDASGKPLWRLPLRAKVVRFGRVARVDASVTMPSVVTPHARDIPSVQDAVRDEDVIELGGATGKGGMTAVKKLNSLPTSYQQAVKKVVNDNRRLINAALREFMEMIHTDEPVQKLYLRAEKLWEITECSPAYCSQPLEKPAAGDVETFIAALSAYGDCHSDLRDDCIRVVRLLAEPLIDNHVDG